MYMTGQKYRRAMEQIELSPDQREHLVRAMLQEQPRRKRKRAPVRLLLAAALACGVLTISVLALSPALREYLTQALGSFAPYSQELSGATGDGSKGEGQGGVGGNGPVSRQALCRAYPT